MQKLALILPVLVLLSALVMSISDEETASASVTVNEYVSITLTDLNASGIDFSSLDPGTTNNPADQNATDGTVRITNDSVSNVDVNIYVKGDDFVSGSNTIAVDGNVTYNKTSSQTGELTLANTYGTALEIGVAPNSSIDVWFWLDIPSSQTAGSYTSTFSFKGDTA